MAFTSHLAQDLRYTLRSLRRNPGFAVFAILIAGFGVGASSTVFSVVDTLLLRPLPFEKPSELVWIANSDRPDLSGQTTQVGYLLDLRERTRTLSAVAGYFAFYGVGDNLLRGGGEPERLSGVPVSENFFDVLGVRPMLGRSFDARESTWNGPKAVMLGYALWDRRFNRDPAIVGRSLVINDEPHTVVGVPADERGVVSGLLILSRNLGLITGASVMGAVFALASRAGDVATAGANGTAAGRRITFAVSAALIVAALALATAGRERFRRSGPPRTAPAAPVLTR